MIGSNTSRGDTFTVIQLTLNVSPLNTSDCKIIGFFILIKILQLVCNLIKKILKKKKERKEKD